MERPPIADTPAGIVTEFLHAFMSGDIEHARLLASDEFSFQAPLQQGHGSRQSYFSGAAAKTRYVKAIRILQQWEDGTNVSTLYELVVRTPNGIAAMPVSEWHTVENGKVTSSFMVFDTGAVAAELMRDALASGH